MLADRGPVVLRPSWLFLPSRRQKAAFTEKTSTSEVNRHRYDGFVAHACAFITLARW
ncbi:MAG: hypothetical protein U0871_09420 [Gemmataceae bacterium]